MNVYHDCENENLCIYFNGLNGSKCILMEKTRGKQEQCESHGKMLTSIMQMSHYSSEGSALNKKIILYVL